MAAPYLLMKALISLSCQTRRSSTIGQTLLALPQCKTRPIPHWTRCWVEGVTFKNSQSGCCFIEGFGTDVDWTDGGNSCADVDSAGSRSVQADLLVVPVRSLVLWQLLE